MKTTPAFALFAAALLGLGSFATPAARGWQSPPPAAPAPAPESGEPSLAETLRRVEAGDLPGAIALLEPLRGKADAPRPALAMLGTLYLEAGRAEESLAVLRPLAEAPDADPAVLYNAARAALAAGQVEAAFDWLERSARLSPSSPAARALGMLLMSQGRVVEAYGRLRLWANANPLDGDARLAAASLALQLERTAEAERLLAGLSDGDPAIRLLRGKALVQRGQGAEAVALLEPLAEDHPPGLDLEVRGTLAEAQLLAGRPGEALRLLEGKAGSHPRLVLLLGRAQRRAGDAAAALATLKPLADSIPAEPSTLGDPRPALGIALEVGDLLAQAGRPAEAVPYFETATRLHGLSREAWDGLARALEGAGRAEEAGRARAKVKELEGGAG